MKPFPESPEQLRFIAEKIRTALLDAGIDLQRSPKSQACAIIETATREAFARWPAYVTEKSDRESLHTSSIGSWIPAAHP